MEPAMSDLLRKALFAVIALPVLLRAALRLSRLDRQHDLEELAERMARVRPWRLALLSNPRYLEACVRRFAGSLPPRRLGPCLKRSLLLLDLWSRCGLQPRIHLGVASSGDGSHSFHAWVSVPANEAWAPAEAKHTELWSCSLRDLRARRRTCADLKLR